MSRTSDDTTSRSSENSSDTSKRHTILLDMIAFCLLYINNATNYIFMCRRPYPLNGSFVNTSYLPSASYTGTLSLNPAQISQQQQQQVHYLTTNVQRTTDQLTEEEQIKLPIQQFSSSCRPVHTTRTKRTRVSY